MSELKRLIDSHKWVKNKIMCTMNTSKNREMLMSNIKLLDRTSRAIEKIIDNVYVEVDDWPAVMAYIDDMDHTKTLINRVSREVRNTFKVVK